MRGQTRSILGVASLAIAMLLILLSAASASAAVGHPVVGALTTGVNSHVRSVATDSSDNIYVLASGTGRVLKFDSAGNPVSFSGSAEYIEGNAITGAPSAAVPGGGFRQDSAPDIAVDRSGGATDGYIYVLYNYGNPYGEPPSEYHSQVLVYEPSGVYKGSFGQTSEYLNCAVSVNQGSGELFLVVYGNARRYAPTTGDPSTYAKTGELRDQPFCFPPLPAADSNGGLWGSGYENTEKWGPSAFEGTPTPTPEAHVPYPFPGAIGTDPANNDLYVVREGIRHFDSSGNSLEAPFGVPGDTTRITVDGNHRLLSAEYGGGVVAYSPTTANLPVVAEEPAFASNVIHNSAEVTGRVEPDGAGNIIGCEFKLTYGEQTVPCTPAASPGTPITSATTVTAKFTGLSTETYYQSRLYVTNANGTQMSPIVGFTTPVAVQGLSTDPATAVTKESADLNASYQGEALETHYYFEWGPTSEYGNVAPGSPANAGSGSGTQHVAPIGISGLKGNTTYHFRVVASNEFGVTRGPDQTFTTAEPVTNLTAEAPANITNESAELRGSYTADKYETKYYFEWGSTTKYGNVIPALPGGTMPAGSGKASFPLAPISGLQEGVRYHFRIVAENENGKSVTPDTTFKTAEPPGVDNLDTHEVTATSAVLTGEVNPHSGETSYYFEWGPTTNYGNVTPVPNGNAGSGITGVPVNASLEDLEVGVTYHFRLIATNQYGTVSSVDQSFSFYPPACPNAQIRQETRSGALPDCRGYELVTPKFAQGAVIFPLNGPNSGVATNPAKIAYSASFGSFPAETGEPTNTISDMYISTRTATGWFQKYIGVPSNETAYMGSPPQDWVGNLLQGQPPSRNFLGAQVDLRMDKAINYNLGLPSGGLGQPIPDAMTNAPYVWNTDTGGLIERWPTTLFEHPEYLHFVGVPEASKDFSHFVFSSNEVWAEGGIHTDQEIVCCGPFFHPETVPKATIYDNDVATGTVKIASIKGDESTVFEGWVYNLSPDGSHILMGEVGYKYNDYYQRPGWTLPAPEMKGPLYLRVDGDHTYEIAPGKQIRYKGSTADGETIYLTSPEQLTPEDHDTSVDLYAWHQSDESLTLISIGDHGNAGNTDECTASNNWTEKCGIAIPDFEQYAFTFANGTGGNGLSDNAIAEDSGDIYFESPEQLIGGKGDDGARNLYVYRNGTVRFVAALEAKPLCTSDIEAGGCSSGPVARMQVTPNGDHMALITNTHLTGYDSGEHGEMYIFDPETGRFACASCRRDGKPPVGETLASQNGLFLTNDGRAFFVTDDPLVPKDTNQTDDVYEFTEGKAWLISAGLGKTIKTFGGFVGGQSKPGLVGVSRNGTDVYFATFDTLVTQDHNGGAIKIYDARTGGGFPAERVPAKCAAADECHGPSSERPALAPDRTSADLGEPKVAKTKHKKSKHKKHKKSKKHKKKGHTRRGGNG